MIMLDLYISIFLDWGGVRAAGLEVSAGLTRPNI